MEVSSNLKVDVFEATSDPWVQLHVCEGSSPKRGGFTTIFRAKIDNNCFFHFFAIFYSELSQKNIFACTYLYLFGDILHILWSQIKKVGNYALFL